MVLILLPLLCNHNNLILKSETNSYVDEGWLFISRFKVGSVPGMINKEMLAQYMYKPV